MAAKQKIKNYRVSKRSKQLFFESIVLMMTSGVDVASTLEAVRDETPDKQMHSLISDMITEVYNGTPFWRTLEMYNVLSENMSRVIKVGEDSGNLNRNMLIVLEQQRKDNAINAKLRSASLYPMIVFGVLVVVGLAVSIFVLPKLVEVYAALKVDMPGITSVIIDFGKFLGGNGKYYLIVGLAFMFFLALVIFKFSKTKWIGQNILFTFGPTKKVLSQLEFARMGFLMNGLLASGFSQVDSFKILSETTTLHFYSKFYNDVGLQIEEGNSFTSIFASHRKAKKLFPVFIRQALCTAEKSGGVQEAFNHISNTFESEHQDTVNNFSTAFEPVLLFVVWIFVALLAIAVVLPIYSLVGSFTDVEGTNRNTTQTNTTETTNTETEKTVEEIVVTLENVVVKSTVKQAKVYSTVTRTTTLHTAKANEQYPVRTKLRGGMRLSTVQAKLVGFQLQMSTW